MKLIVGLGNPGRKYEQTRHNVGFIVAAKLAASTAASQPKVKFEGELAESSIAGQKVAILCPQTYMNASGRSVRKALDFYKLDLQDVLVVCDDLNLPSGRLRIRASGSAGGQNGIKDIIRHLGSESFPRLRVGIGRPPDGWTVTDYVLGKFSKEEHEQFEQATSLAVNAVVTYVKDGVTNAMSEYNADPKPMQPKKQKTKSNGEDTKSNQANASASPPISDKSSASEP